MELKRIERVLLINQYEILKRLDSENESHYDELIEILQRGYHIFYSMVDEWVGEDMPIDKGHFVLTVLNLYRMIENYKKENPADTDIANHLWGYFHGFDGNEEGEFFGFTRFLLETQQKYGEQLQYQSKTDNFNSHSPVLDKYQRMIETWNKFGKDFHIPKEKILEILDS